MHRIVDSLARAFAQLGGAVLTALVLLTCVSVFGRSLNTVLHSEPVQDVAPGLAAWLLALGIGPVDGDFELVESGMAFAIFAFLPICQLRGGHASVDIFTARLPARASRSLQAVIEVVFAGVMVLVAWQLMQGMISKRASGQTTFLLEFPIWWAYALSLSAAACAALVAVYVALVRVAEAMTGHAILPPAPEGTE